MAKILLLQMTFREHLFGEKWEFEECLSAPTGLLYVASPLINKGHDVKFIDLNVDHYEKKGFMNVAKEMDYLLITCYNSSVNKIRFLISEVRKVNNNIKVICGGPYCNISQEFFKGSDYTCVGEAENCIADLIDSIDNKKSLDKFPGLFYKRNGKIVKNEGVMFVENLDTSLPPNRDIIKGKDYGYLDGIKLNIAVIISSRGCPFSCRYCTYKNIKYRVRSPKKILEEIREIKNMGYEYLIFGDDNALAIKSRINELMDLIIKEKIKLKIILIGRVDSADLELYKKMRKAGVFLMNLGIESANQDVLDYYNKRITVEKSVKAIKIANQAGIITLGYFMIGAPFETGKHFKINKKFFDETELDLIILNILYFEKGSKLWNELYEKNLVKSDDYFVMNGEKFSNYTYKEWSKIKNDLLNHFFLNPKRLARILFKLLKAGEMGILFKFIKKHGIRSMFNFLKNPTTQETAQYYTYKKNE